jgi:anti-sigma regulatory factor (Ser/Thr protein kinase)
MARFAVEVTPSPEALGQLTDNVTEFLEGAGVDARAVHHVALVIEEILTNVATHGGCPDAPASVALEVQPDRVAGEIGDRGRPFDLRDAPPPDIGASIEDRKIGGLGMHLVRKLTSALDYRREGEQNWTTFCIPRA